MGLGSEEVSMDRSCFVPFLISALPTLFHSGVSEVNSKSKDGSPPARTLSGSTKRPTTWQYKNGFLIITASSPKANDLLVQHRTRFSVVHTFF